MKTEELLTSFAAIAKDADEAALTKTFGEAKDVAGKAYMITQLTHQTVGSINDRATVGAIVITAAALLRRAIEQGIVQLPEETQGDDHEV